ncbi:LapA family protein [Shewanella glacialipiscicola]|uniref:Probable lipopolysaccharide assembly protein A n=1 Tax=Shewanella glacialipiscicola TaxID=614069 RepID=A0ABQ6J5A2_9GAMM|nr:lipopolysaccharide assembly protein LapA domain-containing protein [Shewanella glacialipiscicola]MCL1085870.1 lipopolysaccharide assembly protein LapA domain-containing protein [Shewanella glacialipiscicola]MCU7993346.1 lipopolysaccharide assembly protein LapA domain-containing protein [Shewanella glacialipiscicola]MCU8024663.1 lipopolysaccharide assembly protein LapA domain-containing protein [Shewanella glacialipiscicola]GIU09252.1 putative lipopolysaccharide assembly protein A [Shewanella
MKSFVATVLVALLFILALIFGARNEQVVTISYFVAQGEYRLPVVLAVVFFVGFMLSWLVASYYIVRLKLSLAATKKKLNQVLAKAPQDIDA